MMLQDLRYALRLMLRKPAFAAVAVATLAVGISATTAIFTVVDGVLLRPLAFPSSDRLVVLWEVPPNHPLPVMYASPPNLHDWQERARSYEAMGGYQWLSATIDGDEPEQVRGARVTAGLLRALAVEPHMGRWFLDEEDRAGGRAVAILSDGLWRRRFRGDPSVLGRTISLDGIAREIVGVMPPGFICPPAVVLRGTPPAERAEIWVPHGTNLEAGQRGAHYLTVIARLKAGVAMEAADRELESIQAQIEQENPGYREWSGRVTRLVDEVTRTTRGPVGLLAAAVGLVLLLACANVANLLLARGVGRRREFAVRAALGAARSRIAVQVLAESLALALAGGSLGLLLALGLVDAIVTFGPATIPGLREASIDPRTLGFAAVATIVSAAIAGVVPALRAWGSGLQDQLTERGGGQGAGGLRVQQALVVGQVALAMALLVTAGLLVESFRQLRNVDPGFRPDHVVTGKVTLPSTRYPDAAARALFMDRLLASVRAIPVVGTAGLSEAVPIADNRQGTSFTHADRAAAGTDEGVHTNVAWVTDGYFPSMGMVVLAGRDFDARDGLEAPRVLLINRSLARLAFGEDDPLGRHVEVGNSSGTFEVIGVVGDDRHVGLDADPTPTFFLTLRQLPHFREIAVIARAEGSAPAVLSRVREAVRTVDPALPFFRVRTMTQVVDGAVATPRSLAGLLGGFAASGLMLAAIGLFGVLSHAVGLRTREIGVRLAIGASPRQMLAMVIREGLVQAGIGVIAGLGLAAAASRLSSGLLYGVTAATPLPYVVVAALLVTVAAAACLAPAWRAMRVNPATALRAD